MGSQMLPRGGDNETTNLFARGLWELCKLPLSLSNPVSFILDPTCNHTRRVLPYVSVSVDAAIPEGSIFGSSPSPSQCSPLHRMSSRFLSASAHWTKTVSWGHLPPVNAAECLGGPRDMNVLGVLIPEVVQSQRIGPFSNWLLVMALWEYARRCRNPSL